MIRIKINRQPSPVTTKPPNVGPIAGAIAGIIVPTPIIVPILEAGTCSKIILNINGKPIPVPIPCSTRPISNTEKVGAAASMIIPTVKKQRAIKNKVLFLKERFKNPDKGMTIARTNK